MESGAIPGFEKDRVHFETTAESYATGTLSALTFRPAAGFVLLLQEKEGSGQAR